MKGLIFVGLSLPVALVLAACSGLSESEQRVQMAHQLMLSGSHFKALGELNEAIRLEPSNASAYLKRGQVHGYQADGQRKLALTYIDFMMYGGDVAVNGVSVGEWCWAKPNHQSPGLHCPIT